MSPLEFAFFPPEDIEMGRSINVFAEDVNIASLETNTQLGWEKLRSIFLQGSNQYIFKRRKHTAWFDHISLLFYLLFSIGSHYIYIIFFFFKLQFYISCLEARSIFHGNVTPEPGEGVGHVAFMFSLVTQIWEFRYSVCKNHF